MCLVGFVFAHLIFITTCILLLRKQRLRVVKQSPRTHNLRGQCQIVDPGAWLWHPTLNHSTLWPLELGKTQCLAHSVPKISLPRSLSFPHLPHPCPSRPAGWVSETAVVPGNLCNLTSSPWIIFFSVLSLVLFFIFCFLVKSTAELPARQISWSCAHGHQVSLWAQLSS